MVTDRQLGRTTRKFFNGLGSFGTLAIVTWLTFDMMIWTVTGIMSPLLWIKVNQNLPFPLRIVMFLFVCQFGSILIRIYGKLFLSFLKFLDRLPKFKIVRA